MTNSRSGIAVRSSRAMARVTAAVVICSVSWATDGQGDVGEVCKAAVVESDDG